MKRSKQFLKYISTDSLPTLEGDGMLKENCKFMNESISSANNDGRSITSLIGLNSVTTAFRRRKNFSLILFIGLSALLFALYYTSYYPGGSVWTLRFGVTSLRGSGDTSGLDSRALMGSDASSRQNFNHQHHIVDGKEDKSKKFFLSVADGISKGNYNANDGGGNSSQAITTYTTSDRSGSGSQSIHNADFSEVVRNSDRDSGKNPKDGDDGNGGAGGENYAAEEEIGTPDTWNWKFWASLNYWKVNLTGESSDSEDETGRTDYEFTRRLSGKPADRGFSLSSSDDLTAGNISSVKRTGKVTKPAHVMRNNGVKRSRKQKRSCNFPRLNPFDPSITDFIKIPPTIDCQKNYPLVFRTNFRNKLIQWAHPFPSLSPTSIPSSLEAGEKERKNEWGIPEMRNKGINKVGNNYSCCYKTITRGNGSDHNVIFSKRCYPILTTETEIPAVHEFISVRCRILPGGSGRSYYPSGLERPISTQNKEVSNTSTSWNIDSTDSGGNTNNNYGVSGTNNTRTRIYKDLLAFVPLKPYVEDRIRKYEESRRKFLYQRSHKKYSTNNNNKINSESGIVRKRSNKNYDKNGAQNEERGENSSLSQHSTNDYHENQGSTAGASSFNKSNKNSVGLYENEHFNGNHGNPPKSLGVEEDRLSVVVLGLDAQSHMNFIRQMPQTYNFLVRNLSSIGMYGYTKVGDNTFPNVVTLLSGLTVDELIARCWPTKDSYFDSCPFIWKQFAESGYRTSLAEDSVWMGTFNYEKKGFLRPPTDYYLHPLSLLMAKKIGHETWANAKLCYGPRLAFDVLLDYMVKTAVTFRDSLYFQFIWANSLFHDYLNNPRLGDELLYMTLKYLKNYGYLNKTAFILLSDHGIRWGSIRSTYQGKIEERMPLAYFTFPDWFQKKYEIPMRNLRKNVLRLSTPFDVHETLKDILRLSKGENVRFDRWSNDNGEDNRGSDNKSSEGRTSRGERDEEIPPRGISLFRPIPLQRTCKMAGIEEHWCVCHSMQSVPINSTLVWSGAHFIVQVINGLVSKHKGSCAKLSLFKINEAKRKIDGDIDRGLNIDFVAATTSTMSRNEAPVISTTDTSRPRTALAAGTDIPTTLLRVQSKFNTNDKKTANIARLNSGKQRNIAATTETSSVTITSSSLLSTSSDIKKMIQLQIVVVTTPGNAVFEATIYGEAEIVNRPVNDQNIDQEAGERSNHHWKLSGDISRLNLYGEQSACVGDYTVQKYCYCHNLDNID